MPTLVTRIKWGPDNFEFTGRIKYKKYNWGTKIELEVKYNKYDRSPVELTWFDKLILGKNEEFFEWIHEERFEFREIPDVTIIECKK